MLTWVITWWPCLPSAHKSRGYDDQDACEPKCAVWMVLLLLAEFIGILVAMENTFENK
jgi:hypothetical protein